MWRSIKSKVGVEMKLMTACVLLSCLLSGSAGLMYGYDLVVAGGVSVMEGFQAQFYPGVLRSERSAVQSNYCKYSSATFQLYSSCLYLAALAASLVAAPVTRSRGHRASMLIAGALFSTGTVLGAGAQNLPMLFLGRLLLGLGLGFSNQAVPLYMSEIAPARYRGSLNMLFSINVALGIFGGNVVNYFASQHEPWGWRISLGLAGLPSVLLTLAGLVLLDSPSFLISKGEEEKARRNLERLRGGWGSSSNPEMDRVISSEMDELVRAKEAAENTEAGSSTVANFAKLFQRRYAPQVAMAMALPFFQQVSGNDAILFYGPFLFKAAGLGSNASLYSSVITGIVAVVGTIVSIFIVDKAGRRTVLSISSLVMFVCMCVVGTIFALGIRGSSTSLSQAASGLELAMVCLFVGIYKGSWGPLAWLIPSEIFPQEIRSSAQSVTVFTNMLFKFTLAQTFLSMLCAFQFGIFFFFAGWLAIMGLFTLFLLPETKGVAMDNMQEVWKTHWFWGPIVTTISPRRPEV